MVDDVQPGKIAGRRGRFGGSDVGVAPGTRGISLSAGVGRSWARRMTIQGGSMELQPVLVDGWSIGGAMQAVRDVVRGCARSKVGQLSVGSGVLWWWTRYYKNFDQES
jgi:hypothetical protein